MRRWESMKTGKRASPRKSSGNPAQSPTLGDSLPYAKYAEFAEAAAWAAGEITLRYFQKLPGVEYKADRSPVTVADRESETLLRARIEERFPEHGILGEEFGLARPEARMRWLLDPIDGTQSFIRGVPLYGVMLALVEDGDPVVGVVHFPALSETVVAWRGGGCWWTRGGERVRARVSNVARLEDAVLLATDPLGHQGEAKRAGYEALKGRVKMERGWGDCYGYALVATGRAEIMLDAALSEWDAAPLIPILEEAGGRFTDWKGIRTISGGDGFATNEAVYGQVMGIICGERGKPKGAQRE
ncbi:MAG TPA: histidinol-phosphatase [Candidatus Solibacter sp.]|nr:histidinol-phosphatase [Candidatus Solibacter sp.]